jgi:hypothetical protein
MKAAAKMVRTGIPRRPLGLNDNTPAQVNWRRGLFRVWLLISMAWIMGWTVYLIMYGIQGGFKALSDYFAVPVLLLGPPIALLLFGAVARWAFQGFVPDNKPPEH